MFQRPLIAIDIGSSAIKVVELSGAKLKRLGAIGLETLPPGAVVDGQLVNADAVGATLKELLVKLKIAPRGRRAALSLGGSSVIIKKVNVVAGDKEFSDAIFYEAEQNLQADLSELYFDHHRIGPAESTNEDGSVPVLMVAAKREMVEAYLTLIRSVGMRTGCIECDVFSSANMFEYNYGIVDGLMAIVNIGAASTQVSIVSHGDYLYTRDVQIAGEEYTRQIMEAMGVERDSAENLKVAVSIGDGGVPSEVQKILGGINEQLVQEVQVTIDYFFQSPDAPRDTGLRGLFLTGGGSRILGLDAALAATLSIPVQLVNPFQRIEINPKKIQMDYILSQGHLYGVAVGLGMRALKDNV